MVLSLVVLCLFPLKAYAAGGDLAWAKRAGGASDYGDYAWGIAALADGSALMTGYFSGSATFGPGEAGQTTLNSAGGFDIFIARYNANGTLAWAKRAGGADDDWGSGIAALADGSALMTGFLYGSATFGPGEAGETTLTSAGEDDIFIARFSNSLPTPTAQVDLNGWSFTAGDKLTATFRVNEAIERLFNVYAVIILPDGKTMLDMMTFDSKIKPVATKVSGLPAGFSRQILSVNVPPGAPKGKYELLVAFFDPNTRITGRQDAFLQVSAKFTIQ